MKVQIPALIAAAALGWASAASAHPHIKTASPAADAVLTASPTEIRITFSEAVVPAFSGFDLKDASGKAIDLGKAAVNPKNKKELAAPVKATLAAGTYTLAWHALGDDTHHVTGHYDFEVKP